MCPKYIPVNLLSLLERWFALSETCVKWRQVVSSFVNLLCGVRQGGVLSPYLFAVFIDSIVDKIKSSGLGCYVKWTCRAYECITLCWRYHFISAIGYITSAVITRLWTWTVFVGYGHKCKKSSCMRIGPRFNVNCCNYYNRRLPWSAVVRQPPIFRCLYQFSENVQFFLLENVH